MSYLILICFLVFLFTWTASSPSCPSACYQLLSPDINCHQLLSVVINCLYPVVFWCQLLLIRHRLLDDQTWCVKVRYVISHTDRLKPDTFYEKLNKHLTNLRCSSDFTSSRINACLTLPSATLKYRWWLVRGTFGPGTYDPRINFPTFIFLATSFLVPEFPQIAKTPWVISSITYDDGDDNNHDVWWMLATLTLSWTSSPMTSPLSSSRSMPSVFTISLIVPPCTKITVRA